MAAENQSQSGFITPVFSSYTYKHFSGASLPMTLSFFGLVLFQSDKYSCIRIVVSKASRFFRNRAKREARYFLKMD